MEQALSAFLLGFPALLSIVNPVSGALIFRQVTAERTHAERRVLARQVGLYSFLVIMVALWAGSYVLAFFGVSLAALRVAGGLIVSLSAWGLLNAPEQRAARKHEQAAPAGGGDDVAFYPLTMPFTAGPGTISVAVALGAGRPSVSYDLLWFFLGMTAATALIGVVVWLLFAFADTVLERISPAGSHIVTRLFAFLLLCIGVQILIHGINDVLTPLLTLRP